MTHANGKENPLQGTFDQVHESGEMRKRVKRVHRMYFCNVEGIYVDIQIVKVFDWVGYAHDRLEFDKNVEFIYVEETILTPNGETCNQGVPLRFITRQDLEDAKARGDVKYIYNKGSEDGK